MFNKNKKFMGKTRESNQGGSGIRAEIKWKMEDRSKHNLLIHSVQQEKASTKCEELQKLTNYKKVSIFQGCHLDPETMQSRTIIEIYIQC